MEESKTLAQLKAILEQGTAEAHANGFTAGRAFEAERIRQEATRLTAEQDALQPDQRLNSFKAVVDELLRRVAAGAADFPAPPATQEGFLAVAPPTPEPEKAATKTKAR